MSQKKVVKPVAMAVGAALASSFAIGSVANADGADNPFAMSALSAGYMLGGHGEGSCGGDKKGEGSCGEGSCGGDKKEGHDKKGEGSCGEGSCGEKEGEGSCGEKDGEGKCGEGSCGGAS